MKKHTPNLGFAVETEFSHGFEIERFTIYTDLYWRPIDEILAGTIDNAAGYGSQESAEIVQRRTLLLKKLGKKRLCNWGSGSFTISFQRYGIDEPKQYCDPGIENLGRRPDIVRAQLAICDRLAKVAQKMQNRSYANFDSISNPEILRACLNKLKASEVCYLHESLVDV